MKVCWQAKAWDSGHGHRDAVRQAADFISTWEQALAERAWFALHSLVAMLDDLLKPFREGKRDPIPPVAADADELVTAREV